MSLVLEALRKLEREKQIPDRGFLVMGSGMARPAPGAKRLWWMLGFLAVTLAAAVGWRFCPAPAPSRSGVTFPSTPGQPLVAPSTLSVAPSLPTSALAHPIPTLVPSPSPVAWTAPSLRESAPPEKRLVLTAISQQDGHPVAVLNDRLVREGDRFDGISVLRIGASEVEVEIDGRRVVVSF